MNLSADITQVKAQESPDHEVTIYFPNLALLWSFTKEIKTTYLNINTKENTLICQCSDEEVAFALNTYKGQIK